eukprot:6198777-Pleurochrysis_carterae.AAC.4
MILIFVCSALRHSSLTVRLRLPSHRSISGLNPHLPRPFLACRRTLRAAWVEMSTLHAAWRAVLQSAVVGRKEPLQQQQGVLLLLLLSR